MPARRRALFAAVACAAAAALPAAARAETWPARPIRLVVPFPAGGPTDIVARPFGVMLGDALKQTVIVDNRGGAGGGIGADAVAKAPSDGYTLLLGTVGTAAINVSLYPKLSYDPVRDFTPIALLASAPVAVVVNAEQPIKSARELIAQAKAQPGRLNYGSAGNGTPGHLTAEMFATAAGIKLGHLPYKGSAPAITDLLGNQIPMMFDPVQSVLPHIQSGKLRALAVSSRARSAVLPDVPTAAESGLKGFETSAWWALYAPANLPPDVLAKLRGEALAIVQSPAFRDKLVPLGVQPYTEQPASLADFQKAEIAKWGKAVRDAGVTLE
jgi:tripartite-type tricarboxylate transporter receptor subunit TctC